ncbi:PSD1 and planctomycete cytochrome C domain-containing protein [Tundrisphaera sp. TA3]|uniref:PSD1 and planctomycete cytochrome C domain-containing protein n=1 Tax=Tundrisphaera sp. TA3 TaxID=3435775 RepID=UPI003EB93F04
MDITRFLRRAGAAALLALIVPGMVRGDAPPDPAEAEAFERQVRPLLASRCQSCHGPEKAKGGLRLDRRDGAMKGGDTGPAIVPGKPGESPLIDAINYGELQMPPKSKLPAEEIAILTRWVERGAIWPDGDRPDTPGPAPAFDLAARAKAQWSFQPVADARPPAVRDEAWSAHPVDRFLLAKLEEKGLKPAGDVDRTTLIRRLTFDLIGLPPTAEEVDAFLADASPDADAKVVERLLASPHYGERWARHWLDLARFAETSGHEFDYDIPEAYRYRDYAIRAFNADLPYDRFLVEQVAGDLVPDPRRNPADGMNESVVGTGFWRLHEGVHSPVDLREDAATRIDNQIDVLGKAVLGLTVACARCHDHKFDPISTRDYYALSGYLASSRHQLAFLDPPDRIAARVAKLEAIRADLAAKLGPPPAPPAPAPRSDEVFEDFSGPDYGGWWATGDAFGPGPTAEGAIRVVPGVGRLPAGVAHSGAISDRLRGALRSRTFTLAKGKVHVLAAGRHGRINLVIDGFEKIRSPIYGELTVAVNHGDDFRPITLDVAPWIGRPAYLEFSDGAAADFTGSQSAIPPGDGFIAVAEVRFSDGPPAFPPLPLPDPIPAERVADFAPQVAAYRAIEAEIPEPTLASALADGTGIDDRVHIRGSASSLGEAVPRRFLEAIAGPAPSGSPEGSGRLELARRIADPANPLTARVLVNRLWHHHFGRGIVASVDDFGVMGQAPTHPELLDFLASEFVRSGWSIKAMHRLIVGSRAYRMDSRPDPEADGRDPVNALWHRREVRRLEAEAIRDAILAVSGRLDRTLYGPGVAPHLTSFMEGRGRPARSGPLDGDGRRSVYLTVRRNFLSPMLLAFDFPTPASSMGRRNTSNVPAQALTLLNDPFLDQQAALWAERARPDPAAPIGPSVVAMYRAAFGRPPGPDELAAAAGFIQGRQPATGDDPKGRLAAWADLGHVLWNVKEFTFIP